MCASGSGADHAARRASGSTTAASTPSPCPRLSELAAVVAPRRRRVEARLRAARQQLRAEADSPNSASSAVGPVARSRDGRPPRPRRRRTRATSSGWATCAPASRASSSRLRESHLGPASATQLPDAGRRAERLRRLVGRPRSDELAPRRRGQPRETGPAGSAVRARRAAAGAGSPAARSAPGRAGAGIPSGSSTDAARAQRELPKSSSPPMPVRSVPPSAASSSGTWKWALNGHRSPWRASTCLRHRTDDVECVGVVDPEPVIEPEVTHHELLPVRLVSLPGMREAVRDRKRER